MAARPSEASESSKNSSGLLIGSELQPQASPGNHVTVWSGAIAGIAALIGGAALTGTSYYAATGKALKNEGLDPTLRKLAVPVAARALAVTSLVTIVVGGVALVVMRQALQPRDTTEVGSFRDAIALMRQQREAVQTELSHRKQQNLRSQADTVEQHVDK